VGWGVSGVWVGGGVAVLLAVFCGVTVGADGAVLELDFGGVAEATSILDGFADGVWVVLLEVLAGGVCAGDFVDQTVSEPLLVMDNFVEFFRVYVEIESSVGGPVSDHEVNVRVVLRLSVLQPLVIFTWRFSDLIPITGELGVIGQ
jgi:hypothetical protein